MRILVVEDDTNLNRQLKEAFTEAGYAVDVAFDGEEGHFLGDTEPYDAIVLDIGLPQMDGNELARRLRADGDTSHAVLIALTGYGLDSDRQTSLAAGFDHFFTKPVDLARLSAVLQAVPV